MEFGKAVWYVGDAGKKHLSFVTKEYEHKADLYVLADDGVARYEGVPRRAPADYGPEGGGHTWHLQSESAE
jgi:hypothetical protein